MEHVELRGNFIIKTLKHSRTLGEMFMKLKTKLCGNFQQRCLQL